MKKEKGYVIGMVVVIIMVVSVVSVSAGFLDFIFGEKTDGEEGELPATRPATAAVNVTSYGQPPTIPFVSDPNITDVNLYGNPQAIFSFSFLVCFAGGQGGIASQNGAFNRTAGTTIIATDTGCAFVTDLPGAPYGCGVNVLNYTCNVPMYYYYHPGVWTINATVEDTSSQTATNNTNNFPLSTLAGWERSPTYVNWSSIQVGGPATEADNQIQINLTGNVDIANPDWMAINATNLTGVADSSKNISATLFFGDGDTTPCAGGISLKDREYENITTFTLLHSGSTPTNPADNNLTFCLDTVVGITPQLYRTSPGNDWYLKAFN
jgi:hypothetical protein